MTLRLDDRSGAWEDRAAQPASTPSGWVSCPSVTAPAPLGTPVWSLRLSERHVWVRDLLGRFGDVEGRYGVRGGFLTGPDALVIRVACTERCCQGAGCGHLIQRGQIHGAQMITPEITGSSGYCACCITAEEPGSILRTASGRVIPPLADEKTAVMAGED